MENNPVQEPDDRALMVVSGELMAKCRALDVCRSQSEYQIIGAAISEGTANEKRVTEIFEPMISERHAAWKAAIARRNAITGAWPDEKRRLGNIAGNWAAEEAARREAARRAEEEAERKREEDKRIAIAEELANSGDNATAEAVLDAPVEVTLPPAPKVDRPSEEVSFREIWRYTVTDPASIPRDYMIPDDKKIGAIVRAMKGATKIPGVKVYAEKTTSVRSQR